MPPPPPPPPDQRPPPPKPNQRLLSLVLKAIIMTLITSLFFVFLGVVAIILLHLCVAGRALHRRRNHHHSPPPDSSSGLSLQQLKSLPQFRCGFATTDSHQSECVVCLENFRDGQWCRKLVGCNHVFHRRCVDTWLLKVPVCPLCRSRVSINSGISSSLVIPEDYKRWWGDGRSDDLRIR